MSYKQASLAGFQAATRAVATVTIMRAWETVTLAETTNSPIVTARFQTKALADPRVLPIRTSRGRPRWRLPYVLNVVIPELTPSRAMLRLDDPTEFDGAYHSMLDRTGPEAFAAIFDRLREQHEHRTLALLCFEDIEVPAPDGTENLCHRRLAAAWLHEHRVVAAPIPELVDG